MKTPGELAEVEIPQALARREGVSAYGTVVWSSEGASHVTVECRLLADNADGLRTKLLDVPVAELRAT
jgi:hypothetical protein